MALMSVQPHPGKDAENRSPIGRLTAGFTGRDWAVEAAFLPVVRVAGLRREAEALHARGLFQAAGIGPQAERKQGVRGDRILWLEPEVTPMAWQFLQRELEALRAALNAATFLGLHDFEGHYAAYPAGAAYARHVDNFRGGSDRLVSLVLYLNENWSVSDGGELCLYPEKAHEPVRVVPEGGTLACFLSEGMPHEVQPAKRERLSLTGWFRRRPV